MTIAVAAATGQLGGFVLAELLKTDPSESLIAIIRNPARPQPLRDEGHLATLVASTTGSAQDQQ